jgi:quinol monooxygenase YgiN
VTRRVDTGACRGELDVFVRFHARQGNEAEVMAALRDVVPASRREPGCVSMEAFQSTTDRRLFYIHSRWRDAAAFDTHAELRHTREFINRVDRLLDEPRTVSRTLRVE